MVRQWLITISPVQAGWKKQVIMAWSKHAPMAALHAVCVCVSFSSHHLTQLNPIESLSTCVIINYLQLIWARWKINIFIFLKAISQFVFWGRPAWRIWIRQSLIEGCYQTRCRPSRLFFFPDTSHSAAAPKGRWLLRREIFIWTTAAEGECGFGGMCERCVRRGRVHVCALARRGQSVCLAFFSVLVSLFEHTHTQERTHRFAF